MPIQETLLKDFMSFFEGNKENFGQHIYVNKENGKKEGGDNRTVTNTTVTQKEYKDHLEGKTGLGIIPINSDSQCKFGVLDVDVYDEDLSLYTSAIERNSLPLIPFRSKSGGLHIYLFLDNFYPAQDIIQIMHGFAHLLALDLLVKRKSNKVIETFPKQFHLGKGGIGNWINLPYYNADISKQTAIRENKSLTLDQAIVYMQTRRISLSELKKLIKTLPFNDGPPCLQTMWFLNPTERDSFRNEYLFGFGVYFKKKDESMFEPNVLAINDTLKEPLPQRELETTILASMRKKDYSYRCTQSPCVDFCRSNICKTRTYGVGKEGGFFSDLIYGKLFQIGTNPPYYEWEVRLPTQEKFSRLRFKSEEEIIKQDVFLRLCLRELHILPVKLKQTEWFKLVNQALKEIEITKIDQDDDASPVSLFKSLFIDFILNRAVTALKNQIVNKRVYFDEKERVYYFRAKDLSEYIFVSKGFRFIAPSELHGLLSDFKAKPTRLLLTDGKQVRVYGIHEKDIGADLIMSEKEKPYEPDFEKFSKEAF